MLPQRPLPGRLDIALHVTNLLGCSLDDSNGNSSPPPPQLHKVAVGRATQLLKAPSDHLPLRALKAEGAEGNLEAVAQYARTLTEQKEQLVEVGVCVCVCSQTLYVLPST